MEAQQVTEKKVVKRPKKQSGVRPEPSELALRVKDLLDAGAITVGDLMSNLSMGKIYVRSLLNGHRSWAGIQPEKLRALAKLMGYPPINVMLMAGRVSKEDFFGGVIARLAVETYEEMAVDSHLCACLPSRKEWDAMSLEAQRSFLLLFNAALRTRTQLARTLNQPATTH